ncbi:monooxygenase [Ktedonobacter sp. SOSP1-52]|uniref:FAD-dependent oxidoreductase n=1 Tax=Ktedonobacter sp. SOSP1-52 TaxID=2778366 RepID=UPI001916C27C|nr:FAD-dependent oxidoreductase [Ktedonobacter sp. SOSP1-52]GHO65451.1 monooxygenase [Ktedonobacter sp. SOSP1-52]
MQQVTVPTQEKQIEQTTATCCIVGGGPAGVILAFMLARRNIPVVLLEAHTDFDREFRGDVIYPSTITIMEELGLVEQVLQLRHMKRSSVVYQMGEMSMVMADLSLLKTKYPYIAMINQADFLNLVTTEAKRYPTFRLIMGARAEEIIEENGTTRGISYRTPHGWGEVRADLVVGADGRFSRLRKLAGLQPEKITSSVDVLWFRLSRKPGDSGEGLLRFGSQRVLALIDRPDHWQVGYVIPKGKYKEIRAASLEVFRQSIVEVCPMFVDRVDELREWKQISVLSVESDCLPRWYRPGLLLIGDAAHVMSPVGGVGINCAIQDAVVAANILTQKLQNKSVTIADLAEIQHQRELPTKLLLKYQFFLQKRLLSATLNSSKDFTVPPIIRVLFGIPFTRNLLVNMIVFGPRPAHVKV